MGRSIVVLRAGPSSLHPSWVEGGPERGWDLLLCPYAENGFASDPARGVSLGPVRPGAKWTGLRELLTGWDGWRDYDYVLLPDDDIIAPEATWTEFFARCRALDARLAAPALEPGSFQSHLVTMRNESFDARRVGFVEIMTPCFRTDVLAELLPTLALSETGWGWGLDLLWPKLLGYEGLYTIDATPVLHTRPVGLDRGGALGARVLAEMQGIVARHGLEWVHRCFAGILPSGEVMDAEAAGFLEAYVAGYWYLVGGDARGLAGLLSAQCRVPLAA